MAPTSSNYEKNHSNKTFVSKTTYSTQISTVANLSVNFHVFTQLYRFLVSKSIAQNLSNTNLFSNIYREQKKYLHIILFNNYYSIYLFYTN